MIARKIRNIAVRDKRKHIYEGDKGFMKRIDKIETDLIVSMNPNNLKFLRNKSKSIIRFSGMRSLRGWKR